MSRKIGSRQGFPAARNNADPKIPTLLPAWRVHQQLLYLAFRASNSCEKIADE
jgi:hypothetical protein